jgi:hypothetical protein
MLGFIFIGIILSSIEFQSNNSLRYMQDNNSAIDVVNNSNSTQLANPTGTNETKSNSANDNTTNTDNTTNKDNKTNTDTINKDNSTNSDNTTNKDNNINTDNTSNKDNNTNSDNTSNTDKNTNSDNTINTNNTNGNSNKPNQKQPSIFQFFFKEYNTWDDYLKNIVYDNSFKYAIKTIQNNLIDNSTSSNTSSTDSTGNTDNSTNNTSSSSSNITASSTTNASSSSSNITANNTTNTSSLTRQNKTTYLSTSGSFLDQVLDPNLKLNVTTLPKNAKIRMAITVARPGLFRPEEDPVGQYKPINQPSDYIKQSEASDLFEMPWNPSYNIEEQGLNYALKYATDCKKLYTNLKLTNFSDINETDFISVQRNISISYTQKIFQGFFNSFNNSIIESTDYTDDKLDNFLFTNKVGTKTIAYLLNNYDNLLFGFGYKRCSKYINWLQRAESDVFLKKFYQSRFENILNHFGKFFENRTEYYSFNNDQIVYKINAQQIKSNFSLAINIFNAFYSNLVNSQGNQTSLEKLYEIVPKDVVEADLFSLRMFLLYQYDLYSHMHSYLLISPFYERIFKEFNKAIIDPNYTRKFLYYTGSDHVLAAFFKLFYYKYPEFVKTPNDDKLEGDALLQKDMLYKNCPFIDFGYNIAFELWESQDRSQKTYYVGFRQNNNQSLTFLMTGDNFLEAMKLFYLYPTMTVTERSFWCGT